MLGLFPDGFEERDLPDGVELAGYTDAAGEACVREAFADVAVEDIDAGWEERWRAFHRGSRVGPLWVGPPWEEPPAGALAVVIEPGRAFGTGAHATTLLSLELLARLPRGSLLDVGCGSGVLAIAAAKLGFAPVFAVDLDPEAIAVTIENASANAVEIAVAEIDALAGELPKARSSVANLTLEAVRELAPRIESSHLVTSGYLAGDHPGLSGFASVRRRELDGWAADVWMLMEESEPVTRGSTGRLAARVRGVKGSKVSPMATFSIAFLGCKVSYADAHAVRERLLADGHEERSENADVAVVNTCCVTHEAVSKSRKAVSRLARTHDRVYVTGCAANLPRDAFAGLRDNVVVVSRSSEEAAAVVAGDVGAIACVQADARLDRVRAFIKVQDGCSFSCAFCVIPLVRGMSRSRKAEAVLQEVVRRVAQGHREVVLTGINLGCYRDREAGYDLPRLVREAGATSGLVRLRLSSIEVNHVSEVLVRALRDIPTVAKHLHVPLQSGDDHVLRAMGRRYDAATYLRRVELASEFNLTTDVIVGFPGEDEPAFQHTLRVVRQAGITRTHVFPYSPRPGTRTASVDSVPARVKKERSARLRTLSREAELARWHGKLGTEDLVLVDRPGRGYGDDYVPWLVDAPVGELVTARATCVEEAGVRGER